VSLPDPPTPADCDLQGLIFMPLEAQRLRDSDLALFSTGDEFKAAVLLWCAAWHRVPAGSLPEDDRVLCRFSGLEAKAWKKAKAGAMRGWFKCSDGLLYHTTVSEKVAEAWKERTSYRAKRERDRERLAAWRDGQKHGGETAAETPVETPTETHGETPTETRFETLPEEKGREGKGSGGKGDRDADASPVGSAEPIQTDGVKPKPWERDEAFGKLWATATEQGRTRAKRKEDVWPLWKAALRRWSAEDILAAKAAYIARDPDVQRTGGPGLHIWLREKCEHWIGSGSPSPKAAAWTGPPEVVEAMVRAFGSEKGHGYLTAYCTWQDVPSRALICSQNLICDFIRREVGPAFEAMDVKVMLAGRAA
jgi:hypothetical protein